MANKKDPGVAALLSFLFTGTGQIYNEELGKGIGFMVLQVINFLLMGILIGFITFPLTWIIGMVDAYNTAKEINKEE